MYEVDFPGGLTSDNILFRVLTWGLSEGLFCICIALNYLPQRTYSWVFKGSMILMFVDLLICCIWLPVS